MLTNLRLDSYNSYLTCSFGTWAISSSLGFPSYSTRVPPCISMKKHTKMKYLKWFFNVSHLEALFLKNRSFLYTINILWDIFSKKGLGNKVTFYKFLLNWRKEFKIFIGYKDFIRWNITNITLYFQSVLFTHVHRLMVWIIENNLKTTLR